MGFFSLFLNWSGLDDKFITVMLTLVMVLAGFSLGIEINNKISGKD